MQLIDAPSPNFDARTAPPDMIILHYTGMQTGDAALARLRDPAAKVSSHYMVEEDGRIFALVPETRRAWHAGLSFWKGETGLNNVTIGIEIVNPGHELGYRPFPDVQIDSVLALLTDIRGRWMVPNDRILGHSDIAPARKDDPGELFPWARLAAAGHGVWVEPPASPGAPLAKGDQAGAGLAVGGAVHPRGTPVALEGGDDGRGVVVIAAGGRQVVAQPRQAGL